MKKILFSLTILILLSLSVSSCLAYQQDTKTYLLDDVPFPRLAYWWPYNGGLNLGNVSSLAKSSLVTMGVATLETGALGSCPTCYQKMKELNPKIIILGYVASNEVYDPATGIAGGQIHQDLSRIAHDCYWLSGGGWPGMVRIRDNFDIKCCDKFYAPNNCYIDPKVINHTWNTYLPMAVNKYIFSQDYWSGIYYDNAGTGSWDGVSPNYLFGNAPDGSVISIDIKYARITRDYANQANKYIAVNSAFDNHDPYRQWVNISLGEGFPQMAMKLPDGDWYSDWKYSMRAYFHWLQEAYKPRAYFGLNYSGAIFGLGSILLNNGFFQGASLDELGVDLATGVSSDKFEHLGYLGFPTNEAYDIKTNEKLADIIESNFNDLKNRVYRRDFDNGIVLVNPTGGGKTVDNLGKGVFKRIKGNSEVNNGQPVVDSVTLGAKDALILLRTVLPSPGCPSKESGNLNNDCLINEKDLTILLSQWQPPNSAALLRALFYNWKSK